jgi:hypothetical protein
MQLKFGLLSVVVASSMSRYIEVTSQGLFNLKLNFLESLIKLSFCNDPPPMTQYCSLLAPQTRLSRRSPILGLFSQKHA